MAAGIGRKFALCQLIFIPDYQKITTNDKILMASLLIFTVC
jgi:hypothetical protein